MEITEPDGQLVAFISENCEAYTGTLYSETSEWTWTLQHSRGTKTFRADNSGDLAFILVDEHNPPGKG